MRQLRPVSYYFKKGSESKYMRFGFIGRELSERKRVPNCAFSIVYIYVYYLYIYVYIIIMYIYVYSTPYPLATCIRPPCLADELESVVPQVVRQGGGAPRFPKQNRHSLGF